MRDLHIQSLIVRHYQTNSVVALDCHFNQLLGRPENMDDLRQEIMQFFQNGFWQLIGIVHHIVIMF